MATAIRRKPVKHVALRARDCRSSVSTRVEAGETTGRDEHPCPFVPRYTTRMAEVISIRVFVFFVAFFLLRPLMLALVERPNRVHGLGLLGVSTFLAFGASALLLDDPMGDTMLAWLVIYGIIAGLWFARWKGGDNEERWRRERRELTEAPQEQKTPEP